MQNTNAVNVLLAQQQSGARWFWWIAGLSLVNTVMFLSGSDMSFLFGLGTTSVIDALAKAKEVGNATVVAKVIAVVIDVIIAGVYFLFGLLARNRHNWAYIVGMVFYALDALLCLSLGLMLMAGVHLFALWCIFNGLKASRMLSKVQAATAPIA
jgi:hypothetical protein